jgi:hypothetical protein
VNKSVLHPETTTLDPVRVHRSHWKSLRHGSPPEADKVSFHHQSDVPEVLRLNTTQDKLTMFDSAHCRVRSVHG